MIPKPPEHLQEPGLRLWQDAWRTGHVWLTEADRAAVIQACDLEDERWMLRDHVAANMDDPLNWRHRAGLRTIEARQTQIMHELGLTPKGRANLKDATPNTEADELAAFRARQSGGQ